MIDFATWLLLREARQEFVPPSVLQGYDMEFKQALNNLIQRTEDPVLKDKFKQMLDCPIRDSRGNCRGFGEYVLSALVKNGIHQRYDIEAALSYRFQQMLMDRSFSGQPRTTLFSGFDPTRPYGIDENPLIGRFFSFLTARHPEHCQGQNPPPLESGTTPARHSEHCTGPDQGRRPSQWHLS